MTNNNALIGFSGFVGGHLNRQHVFKHKYNSKNFQEMERKNFGELVCAGLSAVKWLANKEPEKDRQGIQALQNVLESVHADRFILISTIDVYPSVQAHDESFNCHSQKNNAYGMHRLHFEEFCRNHFTECFIIRLPGLFGKDLKKNVIYDLLNNNCLDMININSSYQYYDLENLWSDIKIIIKSNTKLVNLFTEPVSTLDIIQNFFPDIVIGGNAVPEGHYDLQTKYAHLWGKKDRYAYTKPEILVLLEKFIRTNNTQKHNK